MKINKTTYAVWAILLPILLWLHYDTYKGWLTILFLIIGLNIGFVVTKFVVKRSNFEGKTNTNIEPISLVIEFISLVATIWLILIIPDYLTKYFAAKNQIQTCGIVSQINKPSWGHNTFNLKDNSSNFKLKGNLSIGDKVCVIYNPDEKWYGYAYVFKLEKFKLDKQP